MSTLFSAVTVGRSTLPNRFVMAPVTRSRADEASGVPCDLTPAYDGQRAGAGLLLAEGTFPDPMGKGYVRTPGCTDTQVTGWRAVTDAVHAAFGLIFLQIAA